MISFGVKLADIPFMITCIYESTKEFCRDYLTEAPPLFFIEISEKDITNERELFRLQNIRDDVEIQPFTDNYLETIALYRKLAKPLLQYNCIIFHGAAVAVDDAGYLFTARSGTGKTTHAKLWIKNIENSHIINGDKPLIKIENEQIMIYGTLWCGKEGYGVNECVPLNALCILEQNKVNCITPISASEAFPVLYQQTHCWEDTADISKILQLLEKMAQKVKLFRLGCNMEDEAALVSYRAMSGILEKKV